MKISNTIEIKTTPENVFYWLEDPERAMKWQTTVTKYEIIKETPQKVGTTFTEYIEENGHGTEMRGILTGFVPNKMLAFHLEGDYNTIDVNFTLKEKEGTTQITQHAEVHFRGMLKVLSVYLKRKIIKQMQKEFALLKELCERRD
jgi:uncharacterized protein YndB with AHSA1/START domain